MVALIDFGEAIRYSNSGADTKVALFYVRMD